MTNAEKTAGLTRVKMFARHADAAVARAATVAANAPAATETPTYLPAIISDDEIRARGMVIDYRAKADWSMRRQMALNVWQACWSLALYPDHFNRIANALTPLEEPVDLQAELTAMVRAGLLRSRQAPLGRLYELAL